MSALRCHCGKIPAAGEPFRALVHCRLCYLYATDARYRALYDGQPRPPVRPAETPYPAVSTQLRNATDARAEWKAAGSPLRTEDEQRRIHAICEACTYFDAKEDRCRVCGCGLSRRSSVVRWAALLGLPDAIAMATHRCPHNKW